MNKLLFTFFTVFISFMAMADDWDTGTLPQALVHKVVGQVLFDGKVLKTGDKIDKNGLLETHEKSLVQLKIAVYNNTISIGPNTKMVFDLAGEKKYTLEQGTCRWKTDVVSLLKEKSKGKIFTKTVSMGVRGTDFLIKSFALFGEVEIIMLDGEVQMENLEDPTNTVLVKKGQWGGMGGRYGKKIAPPIDIPVTALATFEKIIEAP